MKNKEYIKQFECGSCGNKHKDHFYFDSFINGDEIYSCSYCSSDLRVRSKNTQE